MCGLVIEFSAAFIYLISLCVGLGLIRGKLPRFSSVKDDLNVGVVDFFYVSQVKCLLFEVKSRQVGFHEVLHSVDQKDLEVNCKR